MREKKEYVNKGSDHLRGVTWEYVKRTPFAGEVINGINKRAILEREARGYKEKFPEATAIECYLRAKHYVCREQKHYKSYLKGKNSYNYKGGTYLVEDEQRRDRFAQVGMELEEKIAQLQAEQKLKEENGGEV